MLQRQTLIDDIRHGLAVYQNYVSPGGTLNLTDTNIHAEDFVAGLLNSIHGWNLVSTNQATANYPCIDLIDEKLCLGVQVTSEQGSAKLTKTVECAKTHKLAAKVKHLKVFLLVRKQDKYTVHAKCPGIEFDWQNDVLDFANALQSALGISDLMQLQRLHQHVVESLPSIFPKYKQDPLPLSVPATDPSKAWLPFSSRVTSVVGRDTEQSRLGAFINVESMFSWLLMTGHAGSGKSRLALELCRNVGNEWNAGFLNRIRTDFNWSQFLPIRKTLIVIDYVASRAAEVGEIVLTLSRTSSSFTHQVRILLVEREISSWWTSFSREESQSESAEIVACQYGNPLELSGMSPTAILQIAKEVVLARNGTWDSQVAFEFLALMDRYDHRGRPLFAMIIAELLETIDSEATIPDLLKDVLAKEAGRRRTLINDSITLKKMENLLLLATLVSGLLPMENGFDYLASSDVAELIPNVNLLDEKLYDEISGGQRGNAVLTGFQPDILGEAFVLDCLSADGIAGLNAKRLLRAAWLFQPKDVRIVGIRLAQDFPEDEGLFKLFDLPLNSVEERAIWADMVADMIAVNRRTDDSFSQQQMQELMRLANSFPDDRKLQESAARADYNMGCNMLFRKTGNAAERFDAVVARAGVDSQIGLMAILNLGILNDSDEERAVTVWTIVIESQKASNEMRACALNNRANVYSDRGDHGKAIADRSRVLKLEGTSADRRFVALFRRSESYAAITDHQSAFDDLCRIIETSDIPPFDKLLAKLARAVVLHKMQRRDDARVDLETALRSPFFRAAMGNKPLEPVMKAEQARQARDFEKANEYLTDAVTGLDVTRTSIPILIVGIMLLEDQGLNSQETHTMWTQLSDAIRKNANRMRIAHPELDETPN